MINSDLLEITAKLDSITSLSTLKKALSRAASIVEEDAKLNCPAKDGTLRNSIRYEVLSEKAVIGSNLDYSPYVEFGTGLYGGTDPVYGGYASGPGRTKNLPWHYKDAKGQWHSTKGQKPQPYLIPALEENKKEIIEAFKQVIAEEVHKA